MRKHKGFVLLTTTLAVPVLCGILGLAVDVAYLRFQRLNMQGAADAAAMAGMREVGNGSTSISNAAQSAATSNGFTNGTNGVVVQVNNPPLSGTFAGNSKYVEAIVTQNQPALFMRALGFTTATLAARAVSGQVSIFGACIYALDPAAQNSLVVTGNASVTSGCGVWVNSSNSKAVQVTGNACLTAQSGNINIVGSDSGSNSCVSPAAVTTLSFTDPLASIPAPSWSGCDTVNFSATTDMTATPLNPGVYCGGITLSGNGKVKLNPGTYVLNGGGLNVSSSNVSLTGTGVMFYNTGDATHAFQPISVSGGATISLSAPTSGTYNNMLFFEDRAFGSASTNNTFAGSSNIQVSGALYFRNSQLTYSGGSSTNNKSVGIVADKVAFSGDAFIKDGINGASGNGTGGSPAALVE